MIPEESVSICEQPIEQTSGITGEILEPEELFPETICDNATPDDQESDWDTVSASATEASSDGNAEDSELILEAPLVLSVTEHDQMVAIDQVNHPGSSTANNAIHQIFVHVTQDGDKEPTKEFRRLAASMIVEVNGTPGTGQEELEGTPGTGQEELEGTLDTRQEEFSTSTTETPEESIPVATPALEEQTGVVALENAPQSVPGEMDMQTKMREDRIAIRKSLLPNYGTPTPKGRSRRGRVSKFRHQVSNNPLYKVKVGGEFKVITKEELKTYCPHLKYTPKTIEVADNQNLSQRLRRHLSKRFRDWRLHLDYRRRAKKNNRPVPELQVQPRMTSTMSDLIEHFFDSALLHGDKGLPHRINIDDPEDTDDEFFDWAIREADNGIDPETGQEVAEIYKPGETSASDLSRSVTARFQSKTSLKQKLLPDREQEEEDTSDEDWCPRTQYKKKPRKLKRQRRIKSAADTGIFKPKTLVE